MKDGAIMSRVLARRSKLWIILLLLLCIWFVLFLISTKRVNKANNYEDFNNIEIGDGCYLSRNEFMVNGESFMSSGYAEYGSFYDKGFHLAGTIESETSGVPTQDFQARGISVGSKVYLNPDIPHKAYVDFGIGPLPYCTIEASRDYLFHDGILYVSFETIDRKANVDWEDYRATCGASLEALPETARYLGQTHFVGYNNFPEEELGSNWAEEARPVYQDQDNPALLYLDSGDPIPDFLIYVPYNK